MGEMEKSGGVYRAPLEADWPEAELEYLGKCPVCNAETRSLAYTGLRDKIFFCAPGSWQSWRCAGCEVVYLDPRPNLASIGRAYESYYTHYNMGKSGPTEASWQEKLRRIVPNSYMNRMFGYRLRPSLPLAWLALTLQPRRASNTRYSYRHLPAPSRANDILLDIGCGSGHFLQIARDQLGYRVEGLEFDPRACKVARERGLTVHAGTLPGSSLSTGAYAQITLSHVLEHLHKPMAALREVFELLQPGGRVWIAVPNIAASSLARFGANSRLLEPPRHLVMFDTHSLRAVLRAAGFENIQLLPDVLGTEFVFDMSWMIEHGLDPQATDRSIIPEGERLVPASGRVGLSGRHDAEIITMIGTKPK